MGFILRILFSGLMVFVPSQDGKQLTVLFLNVDHAHHLSDGSRLPSHKALLLARAGGCTGDCSRRDAAVASIVFPDKPAEAAADALEAAVLKGGVMRLSGSELSIRKGKSGDPDLPPLVLREGLRRTVDGHPLAIPTTSLEREDVSWIADLSQICSDCALDPSVHAAQPPGLIAARLVLRTGSVFTYSVARIGTNVTPVHFNRLDGHGSTSPYSQAVATFVGADVAIAGNSVEIVESKFAGGPQRSMLLTPDANNRIELVLLNLPKFVPPASPHNDAPQVGKHFEMYYDLAERPPAIETRMVPRAGAAPGTSAFPDVDWQLIHPPDVLWSDLLNQIRLNVGRSAYDRILCPPTQNTP